MQPFKHFFLYNFQTIRDYGNALLNSKGGFLVFGVQENGWYNDHCEFGFLFFSCMQCDWFGSRVFLIYSMFVLCIRSDGEYDVPCSDTNVRTEENQLRELEAPNKTYKTNLLTNKPKSNLGSNPGGFGELQALAYYVIKIFFSLLELSYTFWHFLISLGKISGVNMSRQSEDLYRLSLDRELRNFSPAVSPNLYRYSIRGQFISYCIPVRHKLITCHILCYPLEEKKYSLIRLHFQASTVKVILDMHFI